MTSSLAKVNKSSGEHFRALFLKFPNFLMFLNTFPFDAANCLFPYLR